MALPLISLRDASVAHRDGLPPAISGVTLDVHRGDWIAVAGDNGSGKTTLLAALGGVLPLRSGSQDRTSGLRTALLLQEPDNQFVATSVEHELALSVPRDVDDATRRERIAAAIERFELGTFLARNPHRLSGGEKQRLAFATVWLESPGLLLLDEPLSFLDDEMRDRIVAFVREMNAGGVAIVWATPGGDDVALARTVVVLENGRMTRSDRVTRATGALPEVGSAPLPPAWVRNEARIRFESVSFRYESGRVIENLDLEVAPGECAGITGRNGSGKSTFLLLAGGALAPSSGRITRGVGGHGVLYLPQSPERLFFAESVREEICFGLERRGVTKDAARRRAESALTAVGLDAARFMERSPFELSFGEMRRVAFAIAWALEPELLLLDEPASCLDLAGRAVLDAFVRAASERGAAVMVASHEKNASLRAGRVLELRNGALVERAGARTPAD